MALIAGQGLKKGDAYFKVREIIHMEFQNFVIFSFQVTIRTSVMISSLIYTRTFIFFPFFYCILIPYVFYSSYGLIVIRFLISAAL